MNKIKKEEEYSWWRENRSKTTLILAYSSFRKIRILRKLEININHKKYSVQLITEDILSCKTN